MHAPPCFAASTIPHRWSAPIWLGGRRRGLHLLGLPDCLCDSANVRGCLVRLGLEGTLRQLLALLRLSHASGQLLLEPHVLAYPRQVRLRLCGNLEAALHAGHLVNRRLEGQALLTLLLRLRASCLVRALSSHLLARAQLLHASRPPRARRVRDSRGEGALLDLITREVAEAALAVCHGGELLTLLLGLFGDSLQEALARHAFARPQHLCRRTAGGSRSTLVFCRAIGSSAVRHWANARTARGTRRRTLHAFALGRHRLRSLLLGHALPV
mmetsp:Transcript_24501/g.62494  ORF Transcript_24501/g.62494 Transcript_24501/m.62494 type:complete len:270 (-) Transcript_24501:404-1213(-)